MLMRLCDLGAYLHNFPDEGELDAADYWDPDSPEDYKGGHIIPNGTGKLTFSVNGEVFEGEFERGKFLGKLD